MSVALPVVAIVFGSVTPPQDDVIDLRVHLGCTKEVSSFDCLLQNFDKKYSPGGTFPINVGDNGSISIGRGANCPLIITLRVEEIEPESTPLENYIRVRGRCWGEKLFRKVVTKTYEDTKGEEIVKDLMDYYVGLSHVRDSTELVENTDTTYTLLEYENTPVWDILKYIAESADKNGVIGFDFRVAPDGKFEFFPRNSKTSPVSLSELIEVSRYSKDIHRIRNKIMVYGLADKSVPADKDEWTESSQLHIRTETDAQANAGQKVVSVQSVSGFAVGDKVFLIEYMSSEENEIESIDSVNKDLIMKNNLVNTYPSGTLVLKLPGWFSGTGTGVVSLDSATKIAGSYSVCHTTTVNDYYGSLLLRFLAGQEVNGNDYPSLNFSIKLQNTFSGHIGLTLYDINNNEAHRSINAEPGGDWEPISLSIGSKNSDQWTVFGSFDWKHIKQIRIDGDFPGVGSGSFWVDKLFFNHRRFEAIQENLGSQNQYGLRELTETDEELHSDNECNLRAKALLDHLSTPTETLKVETTCLDYGTNPLLPGEKIHIILPNENIDSDFRIISVEYHVIASEQTLEITLELGREKPLLADYLYGLRATTVTLEKLMRTKAGVGLYGGAGGGSGGGGSGSDEKVKVSSSDTTADYLVSKLEAGIGVTLTKQNPSANEKLKVSGGLDQGFVRTFTLPFCDQAGATRIGEILGVGSSGKFDESHVQTPCIVKVGDYFYLFYYGSNAAGNTRIGVARATTITGPYTRLNNGDPIVPLGAMTQQRNPSVIYDTYETNANKKWKMWLYDDGTLTIYYSYSANPDSGWSTPSSIGITDCYWGHSVLRFCGLYYLGYCKNADKQIYLIIDDVPEFSSKIDLGLILAKGAVGEWDETTVRYFGLVYILGVLYMVYSGQKPTAPIIQIGLAFSSHYGLRRDTPRTFEKYARNPILSTVTGENYIFAPSLTQVETKFYITFTRVPTSGAITIHLASIP